jgi:uncharacterized repeat protein (TIGR01451 family)
MFGRRLCPNPLQMDLRLVLSLVAGCSLAGALTGADSPDRSSSGGIQKLGTQGPGQRVHPIRLKSETFVPAGGLDANLGYVRSLGSDPEGVYAIVQFRQPPDKESRKRLAALGVQILNYLPENSYFARLPRGVNADPLRSAGVIWLGAVYPKDKLPARMKSSGIGSWAVQSDGSAELRVKYFQQADFAQVAKAIEACGGQILSVNGKLREVAVTLPTSRLDQLVGCDGVRWIEEATPPKVPFNDGARQNALADIVQTTYGLSGSGVTLGIWDGGAVDSGHGDFGGRVVLGEAGLTVETHATHVAGTMAGSGALSATHGGTERQWRGVAFAAEVVSYSFNDSIPKHDSAINEHDIVLSQNSWGFLLSELIGTCGFYGVYSILAPEYDQIVTGLYGRPISVVFAAGNYRNGQLANSCAVGPYSTIGPPGTAKNVITVGAINSDENTMTVFSSWGPVDDGRLKPELVASGSQAGGDHGTTSALPGDTYGTLQGTSMAAPVVSGAIGLLTEDYRALYNGQNPLPSTIKGLLVHTAADLDDGTTWFNPGPDYASGYGRVQISKAVDQLREEGFLVGQIQHAATNAYRLTVPEGTTEVKVTLVWDDPAAVENAAVALVNDLDLVVLDPAGVRVYPWTLDATHPSVPAVRTKEDRVNVIEQVLVGSGVVPGNWTVQVVGYNVPINPQKYVLIFTPSTIPAPPVLVIDQATYSDETGEAGNHSGFIDPGETIAETIVLRNSDGASISNVTARLSANVPGITVLQPDSGYPDIPSGSMATNFALFSYRVAKTVPCGAPITFTHVTSANGFFFTNTFSRVIGQLTVTNVATNRFESIDVPKAVPDEGFVVSSNFIGTAGRVIDADVSVRIDHTWYGDIEIELEHPDGTTVKLVRPTGNSGANFGSGDCTDVETHTRLDDQAGSSITAESPPFVGSFRPYQPLASLNGRSLEGVWKLRVWDVANDDTGTLLCWGTEVIYQQEGYVCSLFNRTPVASNHNVTVVHEGATNIVLMAGDPDDDPLVFQIISLPLHGVLSAFDTNSGLVTYRPAPGYAGSDHFSFAVSDGYANSATGGVSLTVLPPQADLSLTMAGSPDPSVLGSNVTFVLSVTNRGPNPATHVILTVPLTNGLFVLSAESSQGSCSNLQGVVNCLLDELAVGASATVQIVARSLQSGLLTNAAVATAAEADVDLSNNATTAVSLVKLEADLSVGQASVPEPVLIGSAVTYVLSVTNRGPNTATRLILEDRLPADANLASVATSQGAATNISGTIRCELGELTVGSVATVSIVVQPLQTGPITNAARVSSDEIDPVPADNAVETVVAVQPTVDLAVIQQTVPASGLLQQELRWILTVTNRGPSLATAVQLGDVLPANVNLLALETSQGTSTNADGTVICQLGELNGGSSATVTLTVVPIDVGPVTNVVSVVAAESDSNGDDNRVESITIVDPAVDLVVTQQVSPDPVLAGQDVTYSITLTNRGPAAATGVRLTDILPEGVSAVAVVASQGTSTNEAGTVVCELGQLGVGAGATVTIVVATSQVGSLTNTVTVVSVEVDIALANNTATIASQAREAADVGLAVGTDLASPFVGRPLTWVFGVTNRGPTTATFVVLENRIPAWAGFVSVEASQGRSTNVAGLVRCELGDLAAGAGALVTVVVVPMVDGLVTNTVTLTTAEVDPNPADNRAEAVVEVLPLVDLATVQTVSPNPAAVGQEFSYALTVTNGGPNAATAVRLENALPAGVGFVSANSSQGGCTNVDGVVICELGDLNAGAAAAVVIVAWSSQLGSVTNTAMVSATEAEAETSNNASTVVHQIKRDTDLSLALAATPNPVLLGSHLSYTLTVTNRGPNAATRVRLDNPLPESVDLVSVESNQGSITNVEGIIRCELGELAVGATATATIVVVPTVAGQITNVATLTIEEIDSNLTDNVAGVVVTVESAVDLHVALDPLSEPGLLGQPLTFSLTVTNRGPGLATGVRVEDHFGEGLALISAEMSLGISTNEEGTIVFNLGDLPSGAGAAVTVVVAPTRVGLVTNVVEVTAQEEELNADDNTVVSVVMIDPAMDLSVSQEVAPDPATPGQEIAYVVTVTNLGPSLATGVQVNNILPEGVELLSIETGQGTATNIDGAVRFEMGELAPLAGTTVTLTVRSSQPGLFTNTATVAGYGADPNPANNTAQIVHQIRQDADLAIEVSTSPGLVLIGRNVSYALNVTNRGPYTATGVLLKNRFPASMTLVSAEASQGTSTNMEGTLLFELGALPAGASATATLVGIPTMIGPADNAASISGETLDTNLADNASVTVVTVQPLADLRVYQQASPNPVLINDTLAFNIVVTNRAPYLLTQVTLTNVLPQGVDLVSITPSQGTSTNDAGVVICDLGAIDPGGSVHVAVTVTPRLLGLITNVVTISSPLADPTGSNLISRVEVSVVETPVIQFEQITANKLVISWPVAADSFVLEVTDRLVPPINWTDDRSVGVIVGDRVTVTIKTSSDSRFYRLRKQ